MLSHSGNKKVYALLGQTLMNTMPDLANELLTTHCNGNPLDSDLYNIPKYYRTFCAAHNINPGEHSGAVYTREKVDLRKVFVCCILHIYSPQVFVQPTEFIVVRHGLVRSLSSSINQEQGNVSKMIREVITLQDVYQEFKERVVNALKLIVSV